MERWFYRIVILIGGLALLLDGLALADFGLHPLAQDYNFHSAIYRGVTVLVLMPITLAVGFLIIRRVPGNVVGPLLIVWSADIAYNSMSEQIGPALFGLYYAYDLIFGWTGLFLLFLHFPDGKIRPPRAARWIYRQLGFNVLINTLLFLTTQPLDVPSKVSNFFYVPALQPYAGLALVLGLLLLAIILALTLVSLVLRYRAGSLLERQQIKWLALFAVILITYSVLAMIVYPLLTGAQVMDPGPGPVAMAFYFTSGLFPALMIGLSVLRYHLWDIDRIIRRTLVYSLLTVILTAIYFGSVVVLQTIFAFLFQLGSGDLSIVLSTLAIAALFTPLRTSLQRYIDQRFFRQKYNTEKIIASFANTARSEVMLEPLADALVHNVDQTVHPDGVWLWLNKK
jgi:hypothetical protein